MTDKERRPLKRLVLTALGIVLLIAAVLPAAPMKVQGSTPKLDKIRVALFIATSQQHLPMTGQATVSSAGPMEIGHRRPEGVFKWFSAPASGVARLGFDQHRILAFESANSGAADTLVGKLTAKGYTAIKTPEEKLGQTLYRVYAGSYTTRQEAASALARLNADAEYVALSAGYRPSLAGPLKWSTGTFASEAEAAKSAEGLRAKGLPAYIAAHDGHDGKPVWSVWLGEASDEAGLQALKSEAEKLAPGIVLAPVTLNTAYAIKRSAARDPGAAYFFSPAATKLWVTGDGSKPLVLQERFEREYRGALEISAHNGSMAVINELPFEQYLYSVVGTELGTGWPLEVLKAQAVAARTFALTMGMKYGIAHISDTVYDQAYKGVTREAPDVIRAVDETTGEILMNAAGIITPFYSSNMGGMTADPVEAWGRPIEYLRAVSSPDEVAQKGKLNWHRIVLPTGKVGYLRSDFAKDSGQRTSGGFPILTVTEDGVNVRKAPYVDNEENPPIATVKLGERLVLLASEPESNAYRWVRGPYTGTELHKLVNSVVSSKLSGTAITSLEISRRGQQSGRVAEVKANGTVVPVSVPDSYRAVFGDLPSILFDVEQTGVLSVLGAGGAVRTAAVATASFATLNGTKQSSALTGDEFIVRGGAGQVRVASRENSFRFVGYGWGHGLGMSQWGALGLQEKGYDYRKILQYYYHNTTLVKG